MVDAPTDEQCIVDYFAGDRSGFQTLVGRHYRELYQFVLRFTNNSAAAEDVVQETFLQVHLSGASFDPTRRFKPWLFTIAANKARDWLRSRSRRREVPLDAQVGHDGDSVQTFADLLADDEAAAGEQLDAQTTRQVVQRVVRRMPDHLREVLVLGYFHGFAYKDMAEILDIPLGTIKSRLHAAVHQFARRYKSEAESDREADDVLEGGLWTDS